MAMQPRIHGTHYMVAAGHYLATHAGFAILEAGGNAVDAGVAAGLTLGVVHSDMVQVSGVAPIMIYLADREEVVTISGLGWWPKATDIQHFIRKHDGHVPGGLLRTVVPAAPDAWIRALANYGTMGFGDVAQFAIRYARDGFPMHQVMRDYLVIYGDVYRAYESSAAIYLPGGEAPAVGENFVQADLARSLQFMADEEAAAAMKGGREAGLAAARAAFYTGDLARAMVAYHRENGGWLTADDLAGFESAIEPPVKTTFHGIDVYTCGPWCQGPVLQQMLSLLKGFDLRALGHNTARYVHVVAEAMKLSFADRERYYGDPRFVDVPLETLLSDAYAEERRALIRADRAWQEMPPPGEISSQYGGVMALPPAATGPLGAPADTSYCCVVDRAGNIFSATPSDVSWDTPVIPGLGFCPSSRGSQSFAVEGHASAVAPGKRPRLTPNPAIAIKPGEMAMPFGTPGGDTQCQGMLQVLLNVGVFGMDVQDAIEAPRFVTASFPDSFEPHRYLPGRLSVEGRIDRETTDALATLGHDIERLPGMTYRTSGMCAIVKDLRTGIMEGGADPRRMSRAMGW